MKRVRIYPPCPECMDPEMKKGGDKKWIQKATKSIERRGTEGKCTGSNYGGPGCPPGSKQYNLAKTFRKMAKSRKKEYGGDVADQNVGIEEFGPSRLNAFKDYIAGQARNAFTQNVLMNMPEVYPGMYQGGGNTAHGYGYNPDLVDINQFLDQEEDINNQLRNSFNQLGDIMQLSPYMPMQWKAKTTFNRKNPDYKQNRATYREQEEGYKNWKRLNDIFAGFGQPYLQTGGDLPKHQTVGSTGNISPITPTIQPTYVVRSSSNQAMQNSPTSRWTTSNSPQEYLDMYNSYRMNGGRESLNDFINSPISQPYKDLYYGTSSSTGYTPSSNASTTTSTTSLAPVTKAQGTGSNTNVSTSKNSGKTTSTGTGSGVPIRQVSQAEAVGTSNATTGSQDKATTVQERRGNATPEQRKKATRTTSKTETGTTSTEKKSEDRGYGYYGEQGYPSIIYPRMGFLNQRTGMLPLILDPNSTHIEEIKTRRALLPGNRIKKITFSHDLNPYGQYGQTQTPTTTPTTTNTGGNESWRTPSLRYPKSQTPRAETSEEQKWFDDQERMMRENPRAFGMMKRLYGGDLPIHQGGWSGNIPGSQDQFVQPVQTFMDNLQKAGVFDPSQVGQSWPLWMKKPKGTNSGRTDAENIQEWNTSVTDDLKTTAKSYNPIMRAALLDPALGIATSIGRNRTMGDFDIADKTAYDAIGTVRHRPVMGDFDFNPTGRVLDPTKYAPVQNKGFSMKCGGKVRKFQQGGSYELTDQEIDDLIASGIGFEYLD